MPPAQRSFARLLVLLVGCTPHTWLEEGSTLLIDSIPGSAHHDNGTWWGYSQSKIVRFGDTVYTAYVDNDVAPGEAYRFVMLMKQGDLPWKSGAELPTSRPGNLVVDSTGHLHALVFEPLSMEDNDSLGRLVDYRFEPGSVEDPVRTVAIDSDGEETVNIRTGASIGTDDTLAVGFGVGITGDPVLPDGQAVVVHTQTPGGEWTRNALGTDLGHDFYYPYVILTDTGILSLNIQDDFVAEDEPNIYRMVRLFELRDGETSETSLVDHRDHPSPEPVLVEHTDLYVDTAGTVHAFVREMLDDDVIRHFAREDSTWTDHLLDFPSRGGINWVRAFEIDEELWFACASWDQLFLHRVRDGREIDLSLPSGLRGLYLYLASPRGGTDRDADSLDLLAISGSAEDYPSPPVVYYRIDKAALRDG